MRFPLLRLLPLLLAACAPTDGSSDPTDTADTGGGGTEQPWAPPGAGVIALETEDGVTLAADYYPSATEGAPAVVLLHMVPPSWDRTSWPLSFVEALTAEGWTVLVPDRRGAGESEGRPREAYEGPNGKYDVAACTERVAADGYGDVVVIGASNGTTSTIDYAIAAPGEGWTEPVALGFMTGGTYTENNNVMEDVPAVPAVFTYSTAERAWSVEQEALDPGGWVFDEYADGDHGTLMFDAAPEVADDLLGFLRGVLG